MLQCFELKNYELLVLSYVVQCLLPVCGWVALTVMELLVQLRSQPLYLLRTVAVELTKFLLLH